MGRMLNLLAHVKRSLKFIKIKFALKKNKYTHLYVGTPIHGNLGDQQIRNSSLDFLKANKINYIEIPMDMVGFVDELILKNITTICLQGGGNLGDVYMQDQLCRDDFIRKFKDKKIVIFPQTIHYDDKTPAGEMAISKQIFNRHPNLTITARENVSFDEMKKLFPNNKVILAPDIVMSTDYTKKFAKRRKNQVLFLTRQDLEKSVPDEKLTALKEQLSKTFKIIQSDTTVPYKVYDILRDRELKKLFKKIGQSKLVITDRLHGMIFSAITSTPCVVLTNYNHKVKSSYETWLKHLDYISFYDNLNDADIVKIAEDLMKKNANWRPLTEKFKDLANAIKE